jgi:hypothetical protein
MWRTLALLLLAAATDQEGDDSVSLLQVTSGFAPPVRAAAAPKDTTAGRLLHAVLGLLCAAVAAVAIAQVSAGAGGAEKQVPQEKLDLELHAAARANDLGALQKLAVRGAVDVRDLYDRTPLHAAAEEGHNQAVGLLLHLGARPDARDFADATPLLLAARAGHNAAVRTLLDAGATAPVNDNQLPPVLVAELVARVVMPRREERY